MPCPTLLTPSDLQYRINAGKFKMIFTDMENAPKADEIRVDAPLSRNAW
jgi:acetyl-CoA synthetase